MQSKKDIVVGGGLGGLACAALLARAGRPVVVFEKAAAVGGRAASQQEAGAWLNLGPHALYRGGAGRRVLTELGVEPAGAVPNGSGSLALDGESVHALPVGLVSMLSTGLLRLGEKLEVARVLQGLGSIDPDRLGGQSVEAWIESVVSRPGARQLLRALVRVTTYVNAPEIAAADEAVRQLQLGLSSGVTYVDGGWQTIADSLRACAVAAGAEVHTSTRVEAVSPGEVRLAGGQTVAAGAVVIAAGPSVAAALVPDSRALAAAASAAVPVRAACLDLALSALPRPRAIFCLGVDQPLYYSVHSATARVAPDGVHVVHAARYLAPGETADASSIEAMLDRLQPGWRAHVLARRFLPQLVVASDLHQVGRPHPGPAVVDAPGVFAVGEWVGQGAMLADASLASAKAAASCILEEERAARPRRPAAEEPAQAWG
ncbi:MAG TPA: FAD-dependent oxidoreductase [Kofleriaceae bacterium]|nr:FAD-dependent oxidoreductase [Kofleriaceae bacterium]